MVLTKAFYAGIYEITQLQWELVMAEWNNSSLWSNSDYKFTRPLEQVAHDKIRGSVAQCGGAWPTNSNVYADSFMGRLQTKTGLAGFDLPTEAQWEYACRAGTEGVLNDGTVSLTNANADARLDLLGRYVWNGGKINGTETPDTDCTTENATAAVGSYKPNNWSLYDMHGNVMEWCLDWYTPSLGTTEVIDPLGPEEGARRIKRGGSWKEVAENCRSAVRVDGSPSYWADQHGFRLFRTLP